MPTLLRSVVLGALLAASVLLPTLPAGAQVPFQQAPAIPPSLEAYRGWATHGLETLGCSWLQDDKICVWPGALHIEVGDRGAAFSLEVLLDRPGRVALPGDAKRFPQDVEVGGAPAFVARDDAGLPQVLLLAGVHKVTGSFPFASAPETLPIPDAIGRVTLRRGEGAVVQPRREEGQVWLGQEARAEEDDADGLTVRIFRRLDDGVPMRLTTRLEVQAAGRARDVDLGRLLPEGARPVALDGGGLPAAVAQDGALRLHVRPGSFRVELRAVLPDNPQAVGVPAHASGTGIEESEAWVTFPDEALRSVELSGLTAVDPARAGVPEDWRGGSSFLARPGEKLQLEVSRRGEEEALPNRLQVHRSLWLDLDGGGFTARDTIHGELHRDWRIDALGEAGGQDLGRVHDGSTNKDALITRNPTTGHQGVELRAGTVKLSAESRLGPATTMPAVGWDLDVAQLRTTLRLPPGWTLLAARGVDRAPGTWIASWTLLDFFLVLMVAAAAMKLFGVPAGLLALAAMVLGHDQQDAPSWLWLHLLAAAALLRVLPEGWLRRIVVFWRAAAGVLLLVVLVPFAIGQIRHGIYPQVSRPGHGTAFDIDSGLGANLDLVNREVQTKALDATAAPAEAMQEELALENDNDAGGGGRYERKMAKRKGGKLRSYSNQQQIQQSYRNLVDVDPKAVVQTGPGVPDWGWSSWDLSWSGPVDRGHEVELVLLSPRINLLLALLRVALMAALGVVMLELRRRVGGMRAWFQDRTGVLGSAVLWLTLAGGAAALLAPRSAQADLPPPPPPASAALTPTPWPPETVLDTLRERLREAESCRGPCTTTPTATLDLDPQGAMRYVAEVFAVRNAGWALPAGARIDEVRIDGQPTSALRRDEGVVWVRIPAGRHRVVASGQLPPSAVVTLALHDESRPARLTVEAKGWRVDGLGRDAVPESSLQLGRIGDDRGAQDADPLAAADLPDFFAIERRLLLGLPWTIETVIRRERAERATLIKVPLVEGEAVMTEGVRVEAGAALVQLDRGQQERRILSQIEVRPEIALTAATGVAWTETWIVECSPIWRCEHEGIAPTTTAEDGRLRPTFHPWPGESLKLKVARPAGAEGQAMTVDRVQLDLTPGHRLLEASLSLRIRASQGGVRKITLPADATLQKVQIGGKDRALSLDGGVLALPIEPGQSNVELTWQQPWLRSLHEVAPQIDLGGPAVNVRVSIHRGEDRWLLWAHGPAWGPAILFWSHLFVLVLLATLLSRLRALPLRRFEWILLCLGFANLPVATVLIFVGWLVALSWRRQTFANVANPAPSSRVAMGFDLTQLGLIALGLFALGSLYAAIHANLLLDIDMQVAGGNSNNDCLTWYVDRTDGALPTPGIFSLPLWVWRGAMLLWSLWLAAALLRWLPWAFQAFSAGGMWRKLGRTAATAPGAAAPAPSGPPRDDLPPPPAT
ncbi:MAG: hypothetical protein H6747_10990 [Deltaproteobacteria bacterium]|nr:hypothetical protein [Deltaproteobacteria bacterium]